MNEEIRNNDVIEKSERKETLLDKGKNLCKAGLGKAKDAGKWIKENPLEAGAGAVEAAAGIGIVLLTVSGLKSTKNADKRSEDLYQAAKEKLENEQPEQKIYIVK